MRRGTEEAARGNEFAEQASMALGGILHETELSLNQLSAKLAEMAGRFKIQKEHPTGQHSRFESGVPALPRI